MSEYVWISAALFLISALYWNKKIECQKREIKINYSFNIK